jgi:hypothetical protein
LSIGPKISALVNDKIEAVADPLGNPRTTRTWPSSSVTDAEKLRATFMAGRE